MRRRKVEGGGGGGGGGKKKGGKKRSRANIISLHGWEWEASEEFVIERLIGKMVADGGDVPGREGEKVPAGTVLYKVLWEGFPPEIRSRVARWTLLSSTRPVWPRKRLRERLRPRIVSQMASKHALRAVCVCSESCVFQR